MSIHSAHKEVVAAYGDGTLTTTSFAGIYEKAMSDFDNFSDECTDASELKIPEDRDEAFRMVSQGHHVGVISSFGQFSEEETVRFFTNADSCLRPSADALWKLVAWQRFFEENRNKVIVRQIKYRAGVNGRLSRRMASSFAEKFGAVVL